MNSLQPLGISAVASAARLAAVATVLLASGAASAGLLTVNSTTVGGATWNRPVAGNPPVNLSAVGTAVAFDVVHFGVDTNTTYDFQSTATSPAGWDNYSFLYHTAFNPLTPFSNVIRGNDDNPSIGLSGFNGIALSTGVDYFLVQTGFDNADAGAYRLDISSLDGTASLVRAQVPEPASIALVALALLGAGAARRIRRA